MDHPAETELEDALEDCETEEIESEVEDEIEVEVECEDLDEELAKVRVRKRGALFFGGEIFTSLEPLQIKELERYSCLSEFTPVHLGADRDLPLEAHLGSGTLGELPGVIERHLRGRLLWVADPETWGAVESSLPGSLQIDPDRDLLLLPSTPSASEENVALLGARIEGESLDERAALVEEEAIGGVVAIGSGTINDIVKLAAARAGVPYVVVGTAASTDGYTSNVASILVRGLKTSVPARSARAVVLDLEIVRKAPCELARAGLGDLMSHHVSLVDWWIADRIEGSGHHELPNEILEHAAALAYEKAAGLKTGDEDAYLALCRALLLSGVGMVIAGESSPASGAEHLLSHLWDMRRLERGESLGLHGAQVGIASLISAAIYQRLLGVEKPCFAKPVPWTKIEPKVRSAHGSLAASIVPHARRKQARIRERIQILKERWRHLRKGLIALGMPLPETLRETLKAAGAPTRLSELGLSRDEVHFAMTHAKDIRNRLTVLDLAWELGYFPAGIDEVLDDAGV